MCSFQVDKVMFHDHSTCVFVSAALLLSFLQWEDCPSFGLSWMSCWNLQVSHRVQSRRRCKRRRVRYPFITIIPLNAWSLFTPPCMQYIDHCCSSGATPLIRASREVRVKSLQTEVCQLLVASKADVSAKNLWYDSQPTHHHEKHT